MYQFGYIIEGIFILHAKAANQQTPNRMTYVKIIKKHHFT